MNVKSLHTESKPVSMINIYKATKGIVNAMQILKGQNMKKHKAANGALLVCLDGEATYECEDGTKILMSETDYVEIPPELQHWVSAHADTQFLLIQ